MIVLYGATDLFLAVCQCHESKLIDCQIDLIKMCNWKCVNGSSIEMMWMFSEARSRMYQWFNVISERFSHYSIVSVSENVFLLMFECMGL